MSDDSMSDKLSRSLSNNSSRTWDTTSDESMNDHDCSSLPRDKLGYLYMQHFETGCPNHRPPLVDKINELAKAHPGLVTLQNVELSPASWLAVAWSISDWHDTEVTANVIADSARSSIAISQTSRGEVFTPRYSSPSTDFSHRVSCDRDLMRLAVATSQEAERGPCTEYPIYHIPSMIQEDKDLSTCFLTFHTLSSAFEDCGGECDDAGIGSKLAKGDVERTSLPPFGLASLKMQGNIWIQETSDPKRLANQVVVCKPQIHIIRCERS